MTPKLKANDLIQKFYFSLPNNGSFSGINNINQRWEEGKKCALIAVDEIIKTIINAPTDYGASWTYWSQVKEEIEKL